MPHARKAVRVRRSPAVAAAAIVVVLSMTQVPSAVAVPSVRPAASAQEPVAFDGERALAHAAAMVQMGPRPLGSTALEQCRRYIEERLRELGLEPRRDELVAATPIGEVPMANILADVPATGDGRVLLLTGHYDTKRFDGVDFVGANDGASSAAVVLELARVLVAHPPAVPVRLVFFDGEEAVVSWSDTDSTYGSRHMVARLRAEGRLAEIGALLLFDMIGDADLQIPRELNSTPWLFEAIRAAALELGHGAAFPERGHWIEDDHLPFLEAGIDALDLIDFEFGPSNRYWHSPFDTLDKLSAGSFQIVGDTVLAALPAIAGRLAASPRQP